MLETSVVKVLQFFLYAINALINFLLLPVLQKYVLRRDFEKIWKNGQRYGRWMRRIFGIQVRLHFEDGFVFPKQFLVMANHRSWLDQFVIGENTPRGLHILAKKAYFDVPIFGRGFAIFECVPVVGGKLSEQGWKLIDSYLERGDCLLIYPEGTRGTGRNLLPFRDGVFLLAAKSNLPLIPVYVLGAEELLSKQKSFFSVRSGVIDVYFCKPVFFRPEDWLVQKTQFEAEYRKRYETLFDERN